MGWSKVCKLLSGAILMSSVDKGVPHPSGQFGIVFWQFAQEQSSQLGRIP